MTGLSLGKQTKVNSAETNARFLLNQEPTRHTCFFLWPAAIYGLNIYDLLAATDENSGLM